MAPPPLISVVLTTSQDHLGALNEFKHLRSLSLPDESNLGMGYNPPWCGNAYFSDPGLADRLEKQRKEVLNRLMRGISTEVIMRESSTLREVIVGPPNGYPQTVWEKGKKGELYESKQIKHCQRTGKVLSSEDLHV